MYRNEVICISQGINLLSVSTVYQNLNKLVQYFGTYWIDNYLNYHYAILLTC